MASNPLINPAISDGGSWEGHEDIQLLPLGVGNHRKRFPNGLEHLCLE